MTHQEKQALTLTHQIQGLEARLSEMEETIEHLCKGDDNIREMFNEVFERLPPREEEKEEQGNADLLHRLKETNALLEKVKAHNLTLTNENKILKDILKQVRHTVAPELE